MIKGIVFDLDGTIYDLDIDWDELRRNIEQKLGRAFLSFEELLQSLSGEQKTEIISMIDQAEMDGVSQGKALIDQATLSSLKRNYQLAILTRNSRAAAKRVMEILQLKDMPIVAREDVVQLKPHPEGLRALLKELLLEPSEVVLVGDSTHDVLMAKHVGVASIIVDNFKLQYIPKGDYRVKTLSELPKIIKEIDRHGGR